MVEVRQRLIPLLASVAALVLARDTRDRGVDVTGAEVGERWRVGTDVEVAVTAPRIPCSTFRGWVGEKGWVKLFTADARPGTYLRVVQPGTIQAGDPIESAGFCRLRRKLVLVSAEWELT